MSAAASPAIFSFQYQDVLPVGRMLHVTAATGVTELCSLFSSQPHDQPTTFVAVNVVTNGAEHKTYAIHSEPGVDPESGYVELVDTRDLRPFARSRAVSGTIEYISGPVDESQWVPDAQARVEVTAIFDLDFPRQVECEDSTNLATGVTHTSCTCARASGETFTCESEDDGGEWDDQGCCNDGTSDGGRTVTVSFVLNATACAEACIASRSELLVHCRGLAR